MRELLVMRHAKSDWSADHGVDHDRPLNDRGARSARLIGRVLTDRHLQPDLIVTSSAVRARTTAELANESGDWGAPLRIEPLLYESDVDTVLDVVNAEKMDGRLMVVGHQPVWSRLVMELTESRVDMKTGTVAHIDMDGQPTLLDVFQPRGYFGSSFDR